MKKENLNEMERQGAEQIKDRPAERIYMHYVDFGINKGLKDHEVECCISGKKFRRGDCWEFYLGEPIPATPIRFVCREEAEKYGYVMSDETDTELQHLLFYFDLANEQIRQRDYLARMEDGELIEEIFKHEPQIKDGQISVHTDTSILYELKYRGFANNNEIRISISDKGDPMLIHHQELPF